MKLDHGRYEKYIGKDIEIIYLDRHERITKRFIEVRGVKEGMIKAYCLEAKGPRIFRIENIMAVGAVRRDRRHG